jgi:hypothetical protein
MATQSFLERASKSGPIAVSDNFVVFDVSLTNLSGATMSAVSTA